MVFSFGSICYFIERIYNNKKFDCFDISFIIIYFPIWIEYFIYFLYEYFKIYNNDKFKVLKNIKSDDFINYYIIEIKERIQYKNIILCEIIVFIFSLFFIILAIISRPLYK